MQMKLERFIKHSADKSKTLSKFKAKKQAEVSRSVMHTSVVKTKNMETRKQSKSKTSVAIL